MSFVKVGICQMDVTLDKRKNLQKACDMVAHAVVQGADIVLLPEMFTCPFSTDLFPAYAEDMYGETIHLLGELAAEYKTYLVGGSIPERENGHIYNTCYVFGRDGKILARHRKLHLFDTQFSGGVCYRESDCITAGDRITVVPTEWGKVGIAICFDMRFAEVFRLMQKAGAQIILIPAAFNMTTGPAHWKMTVRMRALDQQCFVAACAPAMNPNGPYCSYGHSMVASPMGDVVAMLDDQEAVAVIELNLNEVVLARQQLPILSARRLDLYDTIILEEDVR